MKVTKNMAITRLQVAGYLTEAMRLNHWRDKRGLNRGWDGFVRGAFPTLLTLIWP